MATVLWAILAFLVGIVLGFCLNHEWRRKQREWEIEESQAREYTMVRPDSRLE